MMERVKIFLGWRGSEESSINADVQNTPYSGHFLVHDGHEYLRHERFDGAFVYRMRECAEYRPENEKGYVHKLKDAVDKWEQERSNLAGTMDKVELERIENNIAASAISIRIFSRHNSQINSRIACL